MATTIGLRDPLWRDPGLDLVKFLSTGGTRQPASNVHFRRAAQVLFSKTTTADRRNIRVCYLGTFKLPPKIFAHLCVVNVSVRSEPVRYLGRRDDSLSVPSAAVVMSSVGGGVGVTSDGVVRR
ncbi:unnamed protein product [Macrosiphum euphorbiae]|uniref:Uncharacterized protein n=1 Tax=Macrosiphum euphorbiae TaxID=13131 RepID=A0AAV0X4V2_9HEMI|nr:unnamed protein product [Macrosiphum euphorbiae]